MSENIEVKKSQCLGCHGFCRVSVEAENGRLVRITEDPQSPIYGPLTRACRRARAAVEWFYHPDRLNYPLKRAGERGQSKWQNISWEQALDEIAERLREIRDNYGPEGIATSSGTGRTNDEYRKRFFNLLGSPNHVGQGNICAGPRCTINNAMFGWAINPVIRDETNCILIWGGGTPWYNPALWRPVLGALKRGTKLIAVDCRRRDSAERADIWLQPRPGTDCALIMGIINIIISQGLYDTGFVTKWCHGFDMFAERAQEYSLQKVAGITWVEPDKIQAAARMYAANRPAASVHGMGLEHLPNCMEALHAIYALAAITGNIDVKGGDLMSGPHPNVVSSWEIELNDKLSPEQRKKQLGSDRFKLMSWPGYELMEPNLKRVWGKVCGGTQLGCFAHAPTLYRAMLSSKPYPVRAFITVSSNPMVTQANTKLVYNALKSLDLYVVSDFWMTPSAELADYVLPAASWLERPYIFDAFGLVKSIFACEAALPATVQGQYDRRNDYDLWRGLGIRLRQEEYWPWETLEQAYDYRLAPLGYTLKDFVGKKGG